MIHILLLLTSLDCARYSPVVKRIFSARVLIVAGCIAAALSALSAASSVVIFGGEMLPNLFAELAGVTLEVAIIILVIERVATYQRRRDARFAYETLSDRAAITFVDIMRMLWIRSSPVALAFNGKRYDDFRQLAELHLAEYRSNIEGFAGVLDPSSHDLLRRMDRRFTWAVARLGGMPESQEGLRELEDLATETAHLLEAFLNRNGGQVFQQSRELALAALKESRSGAKQASETKNDRLFRWRLAAQTEYLTRSGRGRPAPRGILYDPDNELAYGYFSIDWAILTKES